MTIHKRAHGTVPLSPSLGDGTAGHFPKERDSTRDTAGTASLKTLAKRVLNRDISGDSARDNHGATAQNAVPCAVLTGDSLSHEWQYRYLERAGIIAEDSHNTLGMFADRMAFLETLVEFLQHHHKGIIGQFKELIKPRVH